MHIFSLQTIQTYLSKILRDDNPTVAREAVFILIRLFKKNVWNDSRTANLIADACLAKRKKVYAPAVRFFLGQDVAAEGKDSDSESESDTVGITDQFCPLRIFLISIPSDHPLLSVVLKVGYD